MNEHRICFVHMPKSAGTSITEVLENNYDADKIIDCVFMHDYLQHSKESLGDYMLYKGHVHYDFALANFPQETKYVTVLRDPVERVLSQYYFVRQTPDSFLDNQSLVPEQRKAIELSKNKGIRDFLLSDLPNIRHSTRNLQLRVLLDKTWFHQNEGQSELIVEKAMQTLESFDCVGVQEFIPFFILEICNIFGFEYSAVPRVNVNSNRKAEHDRLAKHEQEDVLEIIKRYNAEEIIVYHLIKKRIQDRVNLLVGEILEGNYLKVDGVS